jgi:hypothetical protein
MNNRFRTFTFLLALLVLSGMFLPIAIDNRPAVVITPTVQPVATAATNLVVVNRTFNYDQQFNDDDFEFYVYNGTFEVASANITLYNTTDHSKYGSKLTVGDGSAIFYNVPQGIWEWNVTWSGSTKKGIMVSNGPEAFATWKLGNLDWENDYDDLLVTVTDIDGNPAQGLNFTLYSRDTTSIVQQFILGADGVANITDIADGNYTWLVTVASGSYAGDVLLQENFTANGTAVLVHDILGPFAGNPHFYDLEVFTYYETSIDPVEGALVNVTYKNGTVIAFQYTPANGTVTILDLPVAFINWTVSYLGKPVGLGSYSYNLTTVSTDVRPPEIRSPGDKEYILGTSNVTLTWNVTDQYPGQLKFYIDDTLNNTMSWTNQTSYTFNATGFKIGIYKLKLVAIDLNNNQAESTVTLRVYENVTPVITGPEDVEFYYTQTGHSIRWNLTDDYLDSYILYRNGTEIANGSLNQDTPFYQYSLVGLTVGIYNFTLWINDTSNNWASDQVLVTVKRDDVMPVFTYVPPTISYGQGDTDLVRNWTVTDEFMQSYTIAVDGNVVVQGAWTSETISFDFSGLEQGVHYVTLNVTDLGGNVASSTVEVDVGPPTALIAVDAAAVLAVAIIVIGVVVWYAKYR